MGLKSWIIGRYANYVAKQIRKKTRTAVADQDHIMIANITKAKQTVFGVDHNFASIKSYDDFKQQVPIRDYEALRPYIDQILDGKIDVLWPGKPKYFAKTSGTTSGVKYIPLTKDSMPNHMQSATHAVMKYISDTGNANIFDGNIMFLSGSPVLSEKAGIPTGRLSGIVNHEVPSWLQGNQVPTYDTNCIDEWEEKLTKVVEETLQKDMRLIGGIPPWVQMYYERILSTTGKESVAEVFKNIQLFVYGGVNFKPYRAKLQELVGKPIDSIETYPASEGFIAYQDVQGEEGLLLNTKSGIFFEFIPAQEVHSDNPTRLKLDQVTTDVDYALIINNNAGLWGYSIGDSVRFVSLDPYKLVVSGRIKHYISAFGEHVIGKEVETALMTVTDAHAIRVVEFTVAPQVNPTEGGTPYHEWFIEFDNEPDDLSAFALEVDRQLAEQNIYYQDLISGTILQPLKIRTLKRGAFREYMKSQGKLGGQNKVPRLSNDRKIADILATMVK